MFARVFFQAKSRVNTDMQGNIMSDYFFSLKSLKIAYCDR